MVLIDYRLGDQSLQLVIIQDAVDLKAKIAERRQEVVTLAASLDVVLVGEGEVQRVNEVRVLIDDLKNVICGECFRTQAALEFGQQLCMDAVVVGVEDGGESSVFGSKTIQEMANKHPHAVSVNGLLQAEKAGSEMRL